jgi:hypothetical protein
MSTGLQKLLFNLHVAFVTFLRKIQDILYATFYWGHLNSIYVLAIVKNHHTYAQALIKIFLTIPGFPALGEQNCLLT